jgi:hypothetical protein
MRYSYAPGSTAADERDFARRTAGDSAPPPTGFVVVRPAVPYDLATPGTPQGLQLLVRAADAGAHLPPPGGWRYTVTLAVAVSADGGEVVASLALRLHGDLPPAWHRRAWAVWQRRTGDTVPAGQQGVWVPGGAQLRDSGHPDPTRQWREVSLAELKTVVRGELWTPPPPRVAAPAFTVPCPSCGRPARLTSQGRIYASHKCTAPGAMEGRS